MTEARELLAQAAEVLGYTADAQVLRNGRGAFIQVNAALAAIDAALARTALTAPSTKDNLDETTG